MQSALDAVLAEAAANGTAPGLVAMVAGPDGLRYQGAAGRRGVAGPAMTVDTVFRIASMTKAITSAAAMQMVEQGRIGLDDPVGALLPTVGAAQVLEGFDAKGDPVMRAPRSPVTLRHLLTHTSGYSYQPFNAQVARYHERVGLPPLFSTQKAALAGPLLFEPGTGWTYGVGIDWAGLIVEALSGQDLESYLQEHLLGPLGMGDTSFRLKPHMAGRLAAAHVRTPDGFVEAPLDFSPPGSDFDMGGGGLFSTAADYMRFMQMILNDGELDGRRVLQAGTVALMGRNAIGDVNVPVVKSDAPDLFAEADMLPGQIKKWGLSFLINTEEVAGGRAAGSLAWAGLLNSYYWIDPARRTAAVILMQFLPFYDARAVATLDAFEKAVYAPA